MRIAPFLLLALGGCAKCSSPGDTSAPDAALAPVDAAGPAVTTADAAAADARAATSPRVPEPRPSHAGDDAWIRSAPRARTFTTVDLVKDADPAAPLLVEWRVLPEHTLKPLPEDQDSPANHPRPFEVVLTRGNASKRLALGEHGGAPSSTSLTYCRAIGYTPAATATWTIPPLANVVGMFAMETMQSGDETLLLLGKGVLHVLHRRTEDGSCGDHVAQGPLDVCPDAKWSLAFDVKIAGEPLVKEIVHEVDVQGSAQVPFDCEPGGGLLPPP